MLPDNVTVLYVDDDELIRDTVKINLEQFNSSFEIETAPSASAALERIENQDIACIVSDYRMPNSDGLEFLQHVRTEHPTLPFILYTRCKINELPEDPVDAGVDAFIRKQVNSEHYRILAKSITSHVKKHYAEQRLLSLEQEKHVADGGVGLDQKRPPHHSEELITMTVIRRVAALEGVDPVALNPPLSEMINPRALDTLFPPDSDKEQQSIESLTFTYCGYTITISGDREVTIEDRT